MDAQIGLDWKKKTEHKVGLGNEVGVDLGRVVGEN